MQAETEQLPDIGVAVNIPADPGQGWLPVTVDQPPVDHERDLLLCIAWLEWDGERRTGNVVGWRVYVGRRTESSRDGHFDFDEPESMSSKPSADWLGDDREYADVPSFWQPAPHPPELVPQSEAA